MLTRTAKQARAHGARRLHAPIPYVAALLLVATTLASPVSHGQSIAPPGRGPRPPVDDGIPPPVGRPDDFEGPALVGRPRLSDKAPLPPAGPRNFEGVWYHVGGMTSRILRDVYGTRLAYTEEGRATLKHRREMENAGTPLTNPASRCYPAVTWSLEINAPFQILQTDDLVYVAFQEFHSVWQINMNPRTGAAGERTFGGHSVGHWDGNTLVVETGNFKEPAWIDTAGTPASRDVKFIHRIRKLEDGKSLEVVTVVDDPTMYATPWSFARTYAWAPNAWMLGEYDCEVQVGDAGGGATNYGLTEDQQAPQ